MSFNEIYNELFGLRVVLQDDHSDEKIIIRELKIHLRNSNYQMEDIDSTIINFYKYYGIDFSEEFISSIQIPPFINNNSIASFFLGGNPLHNIQEEENSDMDSDDELLEEVDNSDENENEIENNVQDVSDQSNNQPISFQFNHTINFQNMNLNNPNQFFSLINSRLSSMNSQPEFNQFVSALNSLASLPIPANNQNMEDVKVTLEKEDLDKIPSKILEEDVNTKCSICLMDFKKGEKMSNLKCGHSFHTSCIMHWLDDHSYKCPVCRTECGKAKYHIDP